jgi:thioesterase domain-containing protein
MAARTGINSPSNNPNAWRLRGDLNVAALERSFGELVRRHEILRTTCSIQDGEPVQLVAPAAPFVLPILDLRQMPPTEREAEAQRLAAEEAYHRFDLERGSLLRAALVRLDEREHILLLTTHYFVADGMSEAILLEELGALYRAIVDETVAPLPELPAQYADFALWQREWLKGDVRESQLAYWKEHLRGSPACLDLPVDRPRPSDRTFSGTWLPFALPTELASRVRSVSRREGVTAFMLFLAAWQVLLRRSTGQDDIVVATTVSNRGRREAERLLGFFSNNLLLRTDLSGNPTFREVLERVRDVAIGAYSHQDLPFEELIQELHLDPDFEDVPQLQTVLVLHERSAELNLALPGISISKLPSQKDTATFDLAVRLADGDDTFVGSVEYSTDLFEATTIQRIIGDFQAVLESLVNDCEGRVLAVNLPSGASGSVSNGAAHDLIPRHTATLGSAMVDGDGVDARERRPLVDPRDDLERRLVEIWQQVLGVGPIGVTDDFFELGGKSRDAVQLFARMNKSFGIDLPLATLFQAPTIDRCADVLAHALGMPRETAAASVAIPGVVNGVAYTRANGQAPSTLHHPASAATNGSTPIMQPGSWSPLVPIQPGGSKTPFFCVHGAGGNVLNFRDLALRLGSDQPFYGLQAQGVDGRPPLERVEDMATLYLEAIRQVQPHGPYFLGGYSAGGVIAFEMAQQLLREGEQTALLAVLDTFAPGLQARAPSVSARWRDRWSKGLGATLKITLGNQVGKLRRLRVRYYASRGQAIPSELRETQVWDATLRALSSYVPHSYPRGVTLFLANQDDVHFVHESPDLGWAALAEGRVEIHELPINHYDLVVEPHVEQLAVTLRACLDRASTAVNAATEAVSA